MVHALSEIKRIITIGGILLDLRPILDSWEIEVASSRETQITGRVHDNPTGLADDEAANNSIADAERNKWFTKEDEILFNYIYSWDSPAEMHDWMDDEWDGFISIDEETRKSTRSIWATSDGDSRVCLKMKMLITRWRK
jgi:hypothetical protein